ncbi:MAG: hypothetical protein ACJ74F_34615 [Mycobacterium sp.]|jgi:hypothetical protein|uniref:hypothetical protein n=1 Tax=Mycobacterium sp. TaxID=1785 RepID=UPI003899C1B3
MTVSVELLVFSGIQNPVFELDPEEATQIAAAIDQVVGAELTPTSQGEDPVLGFRGFRLSSDDPEMSRLDSVLVARGAVIKTTPDGLMRGTDSAGCENQLIAAARNHGLADILHELGI